MRRDPSARRYSGDLVRQHVDDRNIATARLSIGDDLDGKPEVLRGHNRDPISEFVNI
jgi:hypothetical protein